MRRRSTPRQPPQPFDHALWRETGLDRRPVDGMREAWSGGWPVVHGYSMADLTSAARSATAQWRNLAAMHDTFDIALSGICLRLAELPADPELPYPWPRGRLVQAGWEAIRDEIQSDRTFHGTLPPSEGKGLRPRAAAYWGDLHRSAPDPAAVVERTLGVEQVLGGMDPVLRETLLVVAAAGSREAAAAVLGITGRGVGKRMEKAEAQFSALYWEHETPPVRRAERDADSGRCRHGHPADRWRVNPGDGRGYCLTCSERHTAAWRRRRAERLLQESLAEEVLL